MLREIRSTLLTAGAVGLLAWWLYNKAKGEAAAIVPSVGTVVSSLKDIVKGAPSAIQGVIANTTETTYISTEEQRRRAAANLARKHTIALSGVN